MRLKLARAMPKVRQMLNFEDDDDQLDDEIDQFDKAITKLSNKKDALVS